MDSLFDLTSKIAVVTGALGKLGPVWVDALLSVGATVVGIDLPGVPVSPGFEKLITKYGEQKLFLYRADICDTDALASVREKCQSEVGIPNILVNNAGIDQPPNQTQTYRLENVPIESVRNVLDINVIGALQAIQIFGQEMVKNGNGSIINIGSLYASVSPDEKFYDHIPCDPPFLKPLAYGASKAALINLTKYFAAHWGHAGVRVNSLSPGGVQDNQDDEFIKKFSSRVPMGRMAKYDDLRGPIIFLASAASSYINGVNLKVDGGFTIW